MTETEFIGVLNGLVTAQANMIGAISQHTEKLNKLSDAIICLVDELVAQQIDMNEQEKIMRAGTL